MLILNIVTLACACLQDYIDLCIRNLYPEVGCPGAWDSRVWSPIRE